MTKDEVIVTLRRHKDSLACFQINSLFLFGSIARDEGADNSDIDILVEFTNAPTFDLYMDLKFFLEDLFGRVVDLVTVTGIRKEIKDHIQKDLIRVA